MAIERYPPQGDGYLAEECADLLLLVTDLLHSGCMEIDSRYVDLKKKDRVALDKHRKSIKRKLKKLNGYVKQTAEQTERLVTHMENKV